LQQQEGRAWEQHGVVDRHGHAAHRGRAATAGILLQPIRGGEESRVGEEAKETCGRHVKAGGTSRKEGGEEGMREVEEDEGEAGGKEGGEVVWRRLALFTSVLCFLLPLVLTKHIDRLAAILGLAPPKTDQTLNSTAQNHSSPHQRPGGASSTPLHGAAAGGAAATTVTSPGRGTMSGQAQGQAEEVAVAPFSKRLAYRVDVLFSTHSYVKSLALLSATLVLIALGGLALYAVSGKERLVLADATWRAWTYVADAGNHADSEGVGPRVVSVCISIGGMLVFALMVGLVSEGISDKVDSLRKGKSDVIEHSHTLILGWSDKL
ncbi:hypothetical protein CLOM_g6053, partial [Closterium sp. NIES-68]